jgi:hypothetical protein
MKIKKKLKRILKNTELKLGKLLKLVNQVMRIKQQCKRQK